MEFQHFQMEIPMHYWEILEPMYISFLGSRSLSFHFVRACSQVVFLSISKPTCRSWGLRHLDFHKENIAKMDVSLKLFFMNYRVEFRRFVGALGAAFIVFRVLKTSLKSDGS